MKKFYKINQYIKSPTLRVIDEEGENLGIISLEQALFEAKKRSLDLVEVTDTTNPPVAKIIDFRKFHYNQQKKDTAGKKKNKSQEVKEIRFTPFIGRGDLESRVKKIRAFLEDGDKVKLTVKFVGRQITRKDFGDRVIQDVLDQLGDLAKVEIEPKLQGKMLTMTIKPNK